MDPRVVERELAPRLGARAELTDVLAALYPEPSPAVPNATTVLAQVNACMAAYGINRAPRTMDWGLVLTMQSLGWTADDAGGSFQSALAVDRLARVAAFAAALGVTRVAVQPTPDANVAVPPEAWVPTDDRVNTTRAFTSSSRDGFVSVSYSDGVGGTVTRKFNALSLEETV